jgi:hypothetical protein
MKWFWRSAGSTWRIPPRHGAMNNCSVAGCYCRLLDLSENPVVLKAYLRRVASPKAGMRRANLHPSLREAGTEYAIGSR